MKVFALINDGYQVVYHENISVIEDWKYIYQEHFTILKVFEIEVPDEEIPIGCDLFINFSFNKRDIAQELYENEEDNKSYIIKVKGGLAYIDECNNDSKEILNLTAEERVILKTTRKYMKEKSKKYGNN